MLGNHKLIVDQHSEVYRELSPWIDADFWNFKQIEVIPGAIYIFCRESINHYVNDIVKLAKNPEVTVVIDNAAEGSETLATWCVLRGLMSSIEQGQILLLGGGDMDPAKWPYMSYEYFLPKIFDFDENVETASRLDEFFQQKQKPYKFLFLNGRMRSHRKYLIERFRVNGLLDQSLWTNLDTSLVLVRNLPQRYWMEANGMDNIQIRLTHNGIDLMDQGIELKYLPQEYEAPQFQNQIGLPAPQSTGFAKQQLFGNTWGDAIVNGSAYRDTYFSLVTETVFNYPYSFRTEKIWKPIAVGHPFVAVANRGFYRDLHNMGFQTFGHVIDESFDLIDNSQERIERIAHVVEDLCQQDLASFYAECYNVCKYNQQHYAEYRHRVPQEFPQQFQQFIEQNQ
jgi:hypothetical protein